jgi:hypothetical protein
MRQEMIRAQREPDDRVENLTPLEVVKWLELRLRWQRGHCGKHVKSRFATFHARAFVSAEGSRCVDATQVVPTP